jgi:hypothetical protein
MSNGSLNLSAGLSTLAGELVTLAGLALLDLSEKYETLVGESVTLASSIAASSGPLTGSAASGPIDSLSLSAGLSTLADRVTLALLALSEVSETLAVVAIRVSSGTPRG